MPTSTNVTNLKINELTEAQYDSAVQGGVIGANELSILTDVDAGQVIQVATLPTASADELGKIYQFVGTTDANYTNGYFYKCVSDGAATPTYSWTQKAVQPSSGGGLPTQTGNADKFLTTDGTNANWSKSIKTNSESLTLWQSGRYGDAECLKLGYNSSSSATDPNKGVRLVAGNNELSVVNWGDSYTAKLSADVVTPGMGTTKTLGSPTNVNTSWNITYTKNINAGAGAGNIAVPTVAGSMAVQVSTIPTASSTLEGQIYQFVGATDSTYTNGHFYKCVSDGQNPATYSWTEVSMGGGGSSYTAGTGIDITGGVISVTSPTLTNVATGSGSIMIGATSELSRAGSVVIGDGARNSSFAADTVIVGKSATSASGGVSIGKNTETSLPNSIAIGYYAKTTAQYSIQLNCSGSTATNSDTNTFKVANNNGNYEIMSADGTIPTARLTKVNSTITLTAAGWSSNTQTVSVTGVTADGVVLVSPDPTDQSAYTSAGILCTAQAAGTLTFTCDTVPSADIDVNVVCL